MRRGGKLRTCIGNQLEENLSLQFQLSVLWGWSSILFPTACFASSKFLGAPPVEKYVFCVFCLWWNTMEKKSTCYRGNTNQSILVTDYYPLFKNKNIWGEKSTCSIFSEVMDCLGFFHVYFHCQLIWWLLSYYYCQNPRLMSSNCLFCFNTQKATSEMFVIFILFLIKLAKKKIYLKWLLIIFILIILIHLIKR